MYCSSIREGEPARSVPISRTSPLSSATLAVLGRGENRTLAIVAGGAIPVR